MVAQINYNGANTLPYHGISKLIIFQLATLEKIADNRKDGRIRLGNINIIMILCLRNDLPKYVFVRFSQAYYHDRTWQSPVERLKWTLMVLICK